MHVTFSQRTDYAIRALLDIAASGGERRKTRQIAAAMNIPQRYLSQILAVLVQKGLLTAYAGQTGGYELTRPADDIHMLDVIEVFEGEDTHVSRCLLRGIPCGTDGTCAAHESWAAAQAAMTERLGRTTFAELARQERGLRNQRRTLHRAEHE